MLHEYADPNAIITAQELQGLLLRQELRIYDCTIHLDYEVGMGRPYTVRTGRTDYEAGHIPGSAHLDLQADLSVESSPYSFTIPQADELSRRFAGAGIGDDTRVVLYARDKMQQATRVWWLLRYLGFDKAAILDGGWTQWIQDGRPIWQGDRRYPAASSFTIKLRPDLFVGREKMLAAVGDKECCSLNALSTELHSGLDARYGRPGRIPGSINVPAAALLNPDTNEFLPLNRAAEILETVGATPDKQILNYCGGGIAATLDAFIQHQLGYPNIAVYDNSMSEWAGDDKLPIEVD
ncbi:MAG: sulfurtransferase [Hyphomicrobiaceae bacterium]